MTDEPRSFGGRPGAPGSQIFRNPVISTGHLVVTPSGNVSFICHAAAEPKSFQPPLPSQALVIDGAPCFLPSACAPRARVQTYSRVHEQGITQSNDEAWSSCLHNQALMGEDVIIGYDGRPRCAWAGAGDTAFSRYHDEVWGTRTDDESALFEALTLGVFEAGLSWSVVFGKRDAFRSAFHDFDAERVAAMTERDVDRLVQDPSIIRNRAKIRATIENARAMRSASPSLAALARAYESTRERAPRSAIPTSTSQADAFAKQLKAQGYRFVGPTSVYAFMQNVGVVNDHVRGCFRAVDYSSRPTAPA